MLIFGFLAAAACGSSPSGPSGPADPSSSVEPSSPAKPCDGRVEERKRWFSSPREEYQDRTPSDRFRMLGNCSDRIVDHQPACGEREVRNIARDSPYLRDALALGFRTYICETTDAGAQLARAEYRLVNLLAGPMRNADLIKEAMAKMEGFKKDMCKCRAGDAACGEKVERAMRDYGDSMKGREPDPRSLSDVDKKMMMNMMTEMMKCQQKVMSPAMPQP